MRRSDRRRFAVALVGLGSIRAADGVLAEETAGADARRLVVSGFVDVCYAYNLNRPADHANFVPGVGTSAKRDDEFSINLAQVEFVLPPEPVGFHVTLAYGNATEVVHAAEVSGVATSADAWRNVMQASIQYQTKIGRGLFFEAGVYPSHIGFEAFATKDNWNYTRGWLAELSPYYQTGLKIAYPLSEHWSTQVHLLNGWQVIADNNRGKSVGWQFSYNRDRLSLAFNGIAGPELANDDHDVRTLLDTDATFQVTPSLSLGASLDVAREERPAGNDAHWGGIGLYARVAPPDSTSAFAARAEYYDDQDGAISGTAQQLHGLTLTFEHRPVERLLLRVEGRYDRSSDPVFAGNSVDPAGDVIRDQHDEILFLISAVAKF